MTANRTRTVRPAPGPGAAVEATGRTLGRWWLRMAVRRRRHRQRTQLHALSDAVLRDIGLDRPAIGWTTLGLNRPARNERHI